jgi:hypothetical protein
MAALELLAGAARASRESNGLSFGGGNCLSYRLLLWTGGARPSRPDCAKQVDDSTERHYTNECQQT